MTRVIRNNNKTNLNCQNLETLGLAEENVKHYEMSKEI